MLYLDGQFAGGGGPVTVAPANTNGLYIGSDDQGYESFRGLFLYLEFDTTNVVSCCGTNYFLADWVWAANSYYTWFSPSVGGFNSDNNSSASFSLPSTPTNTFNTNYAAYNYFWLLPTNTAGQVQVNLINPCLGLTYVILTNSHLAPLTSTNWQPWVTMVGSNTVMPAPPLKPASNAMFFRAELVLSTGTNGLPDYWCLQYFGTLNVDADNVNPNPNAHGLDNMQVYENPSVLLADNYSTLNDGVPDWWLVKNGYSITTPATTRGDNGQTLLTSYVDGLNPNSPYSQPGQLPPIDFHIVHGPFNSLVMVLDNVRTDITNYFVYCTDADLGSPLYNQTVLEQFPTNTAIPTAGQQWGRYFQMTNALPAGKWVFTMQGVNSNGLWSATASNTFGWNSEYIYFSEFPSWHLCAGQPMQVVGYTNHNGVRDADLAQILRAQWDGWSYSAGYNDVKGGIQGAGNFLYDCNLPQSVTTETAWGTLTFQGGGDWGGGLWELWDYYPFALASNFTAICATPDVTTDCGSYYTNGLPGGLGLTPLQVDWDVNWNPYFVMPDDHTWYGWGGNCRFNPIGLQYLSVTYRVGNSDPVTLQPGESNAIPNAIPNTYVLFEAAAQTETPTFQTLNYYFDGRSYPNSGWNGPACRSLPPTGYPTGVDGWQTDYWDQNFPVSVTNPVIVAQVGRTVNLQGWSQVLAARPNGTPLANGICWIDQDFAQAYLCDPATGDVPRINQPNWNGQMKINTNAAVPTGILSPNLNFSNINWTTGTRGATFTPTQPGKVIVTTQPDSEGNYGEVTIYVIDMQVDANHDGLMDNRDLTSLNNPMQFWVNNDVDRWHTVDITDEEQDDLATNGMVLDCNYQNGVGQYAIPCTRDLEDYARLWIPGLTNLMQVLPTGYGINLQWRNGTGAGIRIFGAADADGGTNYLFNGTIASNQVDTGWYPCFGYVTSNQPLVANYTAWQQLNGHPPSDHFIFCGTAIGNDELVLQVTNAWGGVAGEASIFLNLQDIKQMYERWSVGEDSTQPPNNIATNCGDQGVASYTYPYNATKDSTPYILHVHGSNMETWKKDRFAETMFKRLYWQGYQGRFGSFRWPTVSGFIPIVDNTAQFYCGIEYSAWQSAIGLDNLLTRLNILYPGQVQLSAHSMGNITAGEALRQAATPLVQTYTAFQGSVPAHTYDTNASTISLGSSDVGEPNVYAHYWNVTNAQYFASALGAANYVNFFNTNDFVLNYWLGYQPNKPLPSYGYDSTWGYYQTHYLGDHDPLILGFPTNTYQIFSFCQQAKCNCIGEQGNLGGQFTSLGIPQQVDVFAAPYSFGKAHKGHSAEFRSDNMSRAIFWNQVLIEMNLKR